MKLDKTTRIFDEIISESVKLQEILNNLSNNGGVFHLKSQQVRSYLLKAKNASPSTMPSYLDSAAENAVEGGKTMREMGALSTEASEILVKISALFGEASNTLID